MTAASKILDEVAAKARETFEEIRDGYMNGGDALSDAVHEAIDELFPQASEHAHDGIADEVYDRLTDIEVD